jgi:hypothetical protein
MDEQGPNSGLGACLSHASRRRVPRARPDHPIYSGHRPDGPTSPIQLLGFRALIGGGGSCPRDLQWRSELLPDDDESWGKQSAMGVRIIYAKGIAQWRSRTAANRWWAGDGAHLGEGEKISLAITSFYRGRRERGSGWVPQVGVMHRRRAGPVSGRRALGSPVPGHWQVAPQSVFESGASWTVIGSHCFKPNPLTMFLYFPKWIETCKLEKPPSCCSKI